METKAPAFLQEAVWVISNLELSAPGFKPGDNGALGPLAGRLRGFQASHSIYKSETEPLSTRKFLEMYTHGIQDSEGSSFSLSLLLHLPS